MARRRMCVPKCLAFTSDNDYTIISQKERIFRMTARFEWDEEKTERIKGNMAFHLKLRPMFLRMGTI